MYNILGIEFEGLKRVLVEIDIPINGSSDFIKRSWQIHHPHLNKRFTFFVGAFSSDIYLRARINLFNQKESDPFFNDEDNVLIKSEDGNIIFEKFKFKDGQMDLKRDEGETSKANENIEENSEPTNSENKEPTKEVEEKQCSICLSKLSENPKPIIVGRKCNYQILLDQFPHTDFNSGNYFIQNQSSINDENILGYIYTFRPTKHPSLSKSVELGFSRSKLATFDVEDIEENEEKKKKGIVIN
uniref:Galectin n=1 Tax=Meloidogyne javanica TaxID=6303 RepID=A0A915LJ86_MELJA